MKLREMKMIRDNYEVSESTAAERKIEQ